MLAIRRPLPLLVLALALSCTLALGLASRAAASRGQLSMIEDDPLMLANPDNALGQMRLLGPNVVRVFMPWKMVAPGADFDAKPPVDATDPRAYNQLAFNTFDEMVRKASSLKMSIDFVITGPIPAWARGPGYVATDGPAWIPNPTEFKLFTEALGNRYSGHFVPNGLHAALPRVRYWELWNEPNFGFDLAPQAINGSRTLVAPRNYRALLAASWAGLSATGHGRDVISIGQLAARGLSGPPSPHAPDGYPGIGGQTKPLVFIHSLYCVDNNYKPLRGGAASAAGCPSNPKVFRSQNPALFNASGFGIHPYPQGLAPNRDASGDPNFVTFNKIPTLEKVLDRATKAYGSGKHFSIFNNEYGYITNPPNRSGHFASPALAGQFINQAEYMSWKDPRIGTTMQYLLRDGNPNNAPEFGGFASGLINSPFVDGGRPKASYDMYRMPIWIPSTSGRRRRPLEIWGAVRPAPFARADTHQQQKAQIQWAPGNSTKFRTLRTVTVTDPHGYIDFRYVLPGTGNVRISWTYPRQSAKLGYFDPFERKLTISSRAIKVTLR